MSKDYVEWLKNASHKEIAIHFGHYRYETITLKYQKRLESNLRNSGFEQGLIDKVLKSGFYQIDDTMVEDSFYGNKVIFQGSIPFDSFCKHLNSEEIFKPKKNYFEVSVSTIDEVFQIMEQNGLSKYLEEGYLSFRGQTNEYYTKRQVYNPYLADNEGKERLIIPSYWRKFKDDFYERYSIKDDVSVLTMLDSLIYDGIENWQYLAAENYAKYGSHSLSDLEDFEDKKSQEYYKRWYKHKVLGYYDESCKVLEQHYFGPTVGLDLTFNLDVALFFALNQYIVKPNKKSTFINHNNGTLYIFEFRLPRVTKTKDLISKIDIFEHLSPLRPIRQECGLPFFHILNFNEAVCYLKGVFHIHDFKDFDKLPDAKYLFPVDEDRFYKLLKEEAEKNVFLPK